MGADGASLALMDGQILEARPGQAALLNLWL
jgi:hypothetical protein